MRKKLLLPAVLLLGFTLTAKAQEPGVDKEKEAIRQVVETYLYAEDGQVRARTISPSAKILSVDPTGSKVIETPVSKSDERLPKGARERSFRQRIVSIDVSGDGASVKVETELSTDTSSVPELKVKTDLSTDALKVPRHVHYLSLLKVGGEWKIVGILMPPVRASEAAGK